MTEREAWIWLISHAEWRPVDDLDRGQLRASHRELMDAWQWETRAKVRACLDRWERDGMVRRRRSIIEIVEYDRWQADSKSTRATDAQPTRKSHATDAQTILEDSDTCMAPTRKARAIDAQSTRSQRSNGDPFYIEERKNEERRRNKIPSLDSKAGRSAAYPLKPDRYPDWFEAAWKARTGMRSSDSKRGAWKLVRRLVIDGEVTGAEVRERTEAYSRESGDPTFKLGWRRWFGSGVVEWSPAEDSNHTKVAALKATPTEDLDEIRPPSEWSELDLNDPYSIPR